MKLPRLVTFGLLVLLAVAATTAPVLAVDKEALMNPESCTEQAPDVYSVKFTTSRGDFVVEVHREWAPLGADRFYNLAKHGFFDGNRFFRVLPGFIVQFGIHGDPELSAVWREANIQDDPVKQSNLPGYVTYAKRPQPNTRTTQLFINLGANANLDRQDFAPFGKITEGMDVVKGIHAGYGEKPSQHLIQTQGNAYLEESFPELDYVEKAVIVE